MRRRYGEGPPEGWGEERYSGFWSSGRCCSLLMPCWSHGACDVWEKQTPLHRDVAQSDVYGHP